MDLRHRLKTSLFGAPVLVAQVYHTYSMWQDAVVEDFPLPVPRFPNFTPKEDGLTGRIRHTARKGLFGPTLLVAEVEVATMVSPHFMASHDERVLSWRLATVRDLSILHGMEGQEMVEKGKMDTVKGTPVSKEPLLLSAS